MDNCYSVRFVVFFQGTLTRYLPTKKVGRSFHDGMFQTHVHRFSRGISKIIVEKRLPPPPPIEELVRVVKSEQELLAPFNDLKSGHLAARNLTGMYQTKTDFKYTPKE